MRIGILFTLPAMLLLATIACGTSTATQPLPPPPPVPVPPPPSPSAVVDDFDRPDGDPGTNWGRQAGIGAPTIRGGRLGSIDSRLVIMWWNKDFPAGQYSETVVAPGFDPVTTFAVQVFVRRQSSGTPWRYGFNYQPSTGMYQLKYDGGSPGIVLVTRPGVQVRAGDLLRIEARGTVLTGYLNGVPILTTTHSALSGGRPGVAINPLNSPTLYGVDVWRGGALDVGTSG